MSDFFSHLVSQVLQPSAGVIPANTVSFAPGADVPGGELVPEPPALDGFSQSVSTALTDRVESARGSQNAPDFPEASKPAIAAEIVAPAPAVSRISPALGIPGLDKQSLVRRGEPDTGLDPALKPQTRQTTPDNSGLSTQTARNESLHSSDAPSVESQPGVHKMPVRRQAFSDSLPSAEVRPTIVPPAYSPANGQNPSTARPLSPTPDADRLTIQEHPVLPSSRKASDTYRLEPAGPTKGGEAALSKPKTMFTTAHLAATPLQTPKPSPGTPAKSQPDIQPLVKRASADQGLSLSSLPLSAPVWSSAEARSTRETPIKTPMGASSPVVSSPQTAPGKLNSTPPETAIDLILTAHPQQLEPQSQPQETLRTVDTGWMPEANPLPQPIKSDVTPSGDQTALSKPEAQAPAHSRSTLSPDIEPIQPYVAPQRASQSLIRPALYPEPPVDKSLHTGRSVVNEPEPPTVHLTIGRIIIRTAPPAAPGSPRPAVARRQPAVSLSDYLNRHGSRK